MARSSAQSRRTDECELKPSLLLATAS
jgi:DNA invertase Pin-like site-specific DNA recombinase